MVVREIKILMIDDHPMILEGYETSLNSIVEYLGLKVNLKISKAQSCDEALRFLTKNIKRPFDVVLLDIRIPPSSDGSLIDGEDLGKFIQRTFPNMKIVVITSISDNIRITSIIKNLNPMGFLTKCEVTPESLAKSIINALKNERTYSNQAGKLLRNEHSEMEITHWDRKLLYYLSIGEQMNNLPDLIPMSMASIERRKRHLKLLFGIPEGNNRDLIHKAKEKGFI